MRMRIALVVLAVGALAVGLFIRDTLDDMHQEFVDDRAAAAEQVGTQARRYADAVAAEPRSPSDARLAELGDQHQVQLISVDRAWGLTVQIRSRAWYHAGGAATSFAEGCYTVVVAGREASVTKLASCPAATPANTTPAIR